MKRTRTQGEIMLQQRVQKELLEKERASGKTFFHSDGKLTRVAKVLYYITAVCSLFVLVLHELILWMMGSSPWYKKLPEEWAFFQYNTWLVHAMIVMALVVLILMLIKHSSLACKIQYGFGAGCIAQIVLIAVGYSLNQALLILLYCIPLISFACCFAMDLAGIISARRCKKAVEEEYMNLYDRFDREEGQLMDAGQWEEFLLSYETALKKGEASPE